MTGDELKEWRIVRNVSQEQLAELLGVHGMTVSKWEREIQSIPPFLPLALKTIERDKKHTKKHKK